MRVRIVLILLALALSANADYREFKDFPIDPSIETKLRHVAESTLKDFPKLKADDLSMTFVDLTNMSTISRGDYHGDAPFYPASVVNLFYLAATYHQKKDSLADLPRARGEIIHVSDNDATAFILDVISDTCSGPELDGRALKKFIEKRSVVNRWLTPLGHAQKAQSESRG